MGLGAKVSQQYDKVITQSCIATLKIFCKVKNELQVLRLVKHDRFSIVKLTPDCVEKFSTVLTCASLWLKQDQLYTENARSGFQRAQRRFTKTKNMWEEVNALNNSFCKDRRDGVVVRASASQSVDLGFIPLVESYQKTLKNGIYSFPAWRSAFMGGCGEQAGKFACCVLGQGT